jgi:multicomponent Na+:H+ antiporter subunit G
MTVLIIYIAGVLIVIGSVFALVASIGLLRLPDLYTRMHAAAKAGTLGSGLMMLAMAFVAEDFAAVSRAFAGMIFILLTAPVTAHLLARAAYGVGYQLWPKSVIDEMKKEKS